MPDTPLAVRSVTTLSIQPQSSLRMQVPLRAARSCVLWGQGAGLTRSPPAPSGPPANAPRDAGMLTALAPLPRPTGHLAVPWPCAGPGSQTLRRGPAPAACIPPPGCTRGLQMLMAGRHPWSTGTAGPPSQTRRVKRSAGWGSWAPLGEASKAIARAGTPPWPGGRGSFTKKPVGPTGLWPGLCRGLPQPPPQRQGLLPPSPQPGKEGQKLPRVPVCLAQPPRPTPGGHLSLTPGLSPPPGTLLQAWPPPQSPGGVLSLGRTLSPQPWLSAGGWSPGPRSPALPCCVAGCLPRDGPGSDTPGKQGPPGRIHTSTLQVCKQVYCQARGAAPCLDGRCPVSSLAMP